MPKTLLRAAIATLTLATVLGAGMAQAATSQFSLSGVTDETGPLAGMAFSGSFAYDASALVAGFSGNINLSSFDLLFAGQTYSLATADATAVAVFAGGAFIGLDFADVDSADAAARPNVSLVSSITGDAADAYLAYDSAGGQGATAATASAPCPSPPAWPCCWPVWACSARQHAAGAERSQPAGAFERDTAVRRRRVDGAR